MADPKGGWLSQAAQDALPDHRGDFDHVRDPFTRAQLLDRRPLTAREKREDQGRGSAMVKKDHMGNDLRPPEAVRRAADRRSFLNRWLAEQRDAVMARSQTRQRESITPQLTREPSR